MHPRIELAGLAGKVGYHVAKEKVLRPAPRTLQEVPPGIHALTPEWLTVALCDGVPGAEVVSFAFGPENDGTSARRAMRVTYNDAGAQAGLLEHLFTKSAPTFLMRMVGAGARLAIVESMFYGQIRPTLDLEAPAVLYAAYDPVSHRQMLITDDVAVTRKASFGTALDRTLTRAQADELVDTLAALHGRFYRAPLRRMFGSWLQTSLELTSMLNVSVGAEARVAAGVERAREVLPSGLYDRRAEIHPAIMRSAEISCTTDPVTFLHGDVHPGNWYVTGDGHLGLYDWSLCCIGGPGRDLAYALTTHLPVADRREWERPLLERYLAQLDVPDPPTFDELWLSYRRQVCYPMLAWLCTIGRGALQPVYQPDEISLANLERIGQAFEDLETLAALREN